jgi:S-(hydroxymethyl)glutathione dehydrogenase/alcohol dehydrogenase
LSPAGYGWARRSAARGRTDVPRTVDWYMDGRINEGFDLMRRGESTRSVVTF